MTMSPSMKCRKLMDEAVNDGENLDRISTFSDQILGHILSFLPTKCSVRTSILSTRWRYLSRLTSTLDFDATYLFECDTEEENKALKRSFKLFVYRVLLLHSASVPIKKFRLCSEFSYRDSTHFDAWINFAILKEVIELELDFYGRPKILPNLPSSLFSCDTLVVLKISAFRCEFKVPESVLLPKLKVLHLDGVQILDGGSVSRFISECSLLENLTLSCCYWTKAEKVYIYAGALKDLWIICDKCAALDSWIESDKCPAQVEIDAPNLAYLTYQCGHIDDVPYYLKNSCSLLNAHLELRLKGKLDSASRAFKLIQDASNVTKLHLLYATLLVHNYAKYDAIPTYPNLTTLHISVCSCHSWECVNYWLANSPRLETVIFEQWLIESKEDIESSEDVAIAPFSTNVKKIVVYDFYGDDMELMALENLLRNARELKMVILYKHYRMTMKRELRVSKKLLTLLRASNECSIQLKQERVPNCRSYYDH